MHPEYIEYIRSTLSESHLVKWAKNKIENSCWNNKIEAVGDCETEKTRIE